MRPKILKSDSDCEAALAQIDSLMHASPGTEEAEELELWLHLVEEYEEKHFPIPLPDPIEAIRFRMDQRGLKQKDLTQYLGSKSRVSEILSGKRPLTLSMIRSLHHGLNIPADVLLGAENSQLPPVVKGIDINNYPISEMVKRGWFGSQVQTKKNLIDNIEELFIPFIMPKGVRFDQSACYKRRSNNKKVIDNNAMLAWQMRVWSLVKQQNIASYNPDNIDKQFIREVVNLSILDEGPIVAQDLLAKVGIGLAIEKNLPKTYLDGAAIRIKGEAPFIAMTLRYDRLDNFWFTLCHELAHIHLHLQDDESQSFLDDLDEEDKNEKELAADKLASDAIIPGKIWSSFSSRKLSRRTIYDFATSNRLHEAIVAGRYRRESGNYKIFTDLLGHRKVRKLFSIVDE